LQTYQQVITSESDLKNIPDHIKQWDSAKTLVLAFSSISCKQPADILKKLTEFFPNSIVTGCSTSGDILKDKILDSSICITVVHFESANLKIAVERITKVKDSYAVGKSISDTLTSDSLKGVLILSDGLITNGSHLTQGLNSGIDPKKVSISGGLAGDGDRFKSTWVLSEGELRSGIVIGVGFYGSDLFISTASQGGWDIFGPERTITKSHNNILYEIDGKPALDLYKNYLGDHSKELPASALLFPLQIRKNETNETRLVRTILNINEEEHSLIFAGNIPEGWRAQLMKANFDRLIDCAAQAADDIVTANNSAFVQGLIQKSNPHLTIAVSCVGRRLVLGGRAEEEVEVLQNKFNTMSSVCGFYSYGELAPHSHGASCDLHNQSMTLMDIFEMGKAA
jgi:hypothetical protein